jgi:hypothetical protein
MTIHPVFSVRDDSLLCVFFPPNSLTNRRAIFFSQIHVVQREGSSMQFLLFMI